MGLQSDYAEGYVDGKAEAKERIVSTNLKKFGFWFWLAVTISDIYALNLISVIEFSGIMLAWIYILKAGFNMSDLATILNNAGERSDE